MAGSRWQWVACVVACAASLIVGSVVVHSQESVISKPPSPTIVAPPAMQRMTPFTPIAIPESASKARPESTTGVVVLGDGRVFQGEVTELAAAYRVQSPVGAVVLPFSQVRTVAPTLPEAYQQLRESYEKPTASDHLDLGWWCHQNKLFEEASAEAQAALIVEPTRQDAFSLLKKSETALGRSEVPETPVTGAVPPRPIAGVALVSTATQVEFSRHVQRLALNKCGNGSCHGASALSPFKIQQGVRSDINLAAMLKYVDPENPEMSPLLVKARTADGPHTGLFRGGSGTEQYAKLLAWVTRAAQDQNNVAGIKKRTQTWREGGPRYTIRPRGEGSEDTASEPPAEPEQGTSASPLSPEIETVAAEEALPASPAPRPRRTAPLDSEAVRELLKDQAPDPFDPEEFNRLVHGNQP